MTADAIGYALLVAVVTVFAASAFHHFGERRRLQDLWKHEAEERERQWNRETRERAARYAGERLERRLEQLEEYVDQFLQLIALLAGEMFDVVGGEGMHELLADAVKQYPSSSAIAKMVEDEQLVTALDDFYDSTIEAAMKLINEGGTKDDWKDVRDDAIERAALVFRRCADLPQEAYTERATEHSR